MKRTPRIAILVALALVFAAPALAATFTTGKYKGKTEQTKSNGQHRKISFHADSAASQITNLKFFETGKCSDGGTSSGDQKGLHADVDTAGKFAIDAQSPKGATKVKVRGTISGTKASGTFWVKSRFNKDTNKADPHGSIKCSSGTVSWSAKLSG
jgi:hypothetical protein